MNAGLSRDFIAGSLLLIFAVVYYLTAAAIPASQLSDTVGPGGLPKAYGIALGLLSLVLIVQSLSARRRAAARAHSDAEREAAHIELHAALRAAGMLAFGIAYVVLLPVIGYVLSLALLIFATAWYQEGGRRPWLIPTSIIGAGVFWLIFVKVLQIDQPAGLWPSLF